MLLGVLKFQICIFCPKTALKPRGELHGFVGGGKGLENGWIIPLEYFLQDFSFDFHFKVAFRSFDHLILKSILEFDI